MTESAKPTIRVATITVSDSRTDADDTGGQLLRKHLLAAGFVVTEAAIVKDDADALRALIKAICDADRADAIVTTGGTGIAPRDTTFEAIDALLEKKLDGFGEAFRRLSWDQIGPRAVLSRAVCGTHRGRLIAALPLAVDSILAPILPHAVALLQGRKHGHK